MKFINMLVLGLMTFAGALILIKERISGVSAKNSIKLESAETTL